MPDHRKHRGPHPLDQRLFSTEIIPVLCSAVTELSWLLSHGYAPDSSLKLVGDRHQLRERQRMAVRRSACSDQALSRRRDSEVPLDHIGDRPLLIDGFNLIVTIESALSGGVLLRCRDGAIRDLASVHGSYRKVTETERAIELTADLLRARGITAVKWLLDRPVSNSGRLATMVREISEKHHASWEVELLNDPDRALSRTDSTVATSDAGVLDRARIWVNIARGIIASLEPQPWVVDLG